MYWLEAFRSKGRPQLEADALAAFRAQLQQYGLDRRVISYVTHSKQPSPEAPTEYSDMSRDEAEEVFARADLLLNFHYAISPGLLARFQRTALVDIDPGLLQFWISRGQLSVPPHDLYFTTGETVGTPAARFPDCADLPSRTDQPLELALCLRTEADAEDQRELERRGWRVRHARDVVSTPEQYHRYIEGSRGEFSCAKRSCMRFQNAWVSDRTVCYLASGKPVVVQDTGPSSFLPHDEGMFRFSTLQQAADAFEAINDDYEHHCRAARKLAEDCFDARKVAQQILHHALN